MTRRFFSDVMLEARIRHQEATGTGYALVGPRLRTRITYDEDGNQFADYRRKCTHEGCETKLTSETRHGRTLLCTAHGQRQRRKATTKASHAASAPKVPQDHAAAAVITGDPQRQTLHQLLDALLDQPEDGDSAMEFHRTLDDWELRERLRRLIP